MNFSKALLICLVLAQFIAINSEIIAIDAGSSGSRVKILTNNDGVITESPCGKDDSAALFANLVKGEVNEKTDYLKRIQDLAKNCEANLKTKAIESIILFSTAGSRDIINSDDKLKTYKEKKLGSSLKTELKNSLKTVFTKVNDNTKVSIDVVSGRYEGIFGFLALNLQLKATPANDYKTQICGNDDVNKCLDDIIYYEIGGSSTQIAFTTPLETPKKQHRLKKEKKGIVEINSKLQSALGNNKFIYSRSFLGNGKNIMADRAKKNDKQCTKVVTKKTLWSELTDAEKLLGKTAYESCLSEYALQTKDNTKPNQDYSTQWSEIISHLNNKNSTGRIVFNAGGTYFPISGGKNDGKKVYQYTGLESLKKDLHQNGYCALYNSKDEVATCPGIAQPEFFLKQLKLDGKQDLKIFIVNFSWLPGAAYTDSKVENSTEAFVSENTNETENKKLSLQDKKRLQKKKAHTKH